ncbi:DUF4388 domain-containing protein [Euhalothece natronophila Z-M001]|uniref:DUF4388 domain-containing protein n=1 Tax=Euhalothece natronophila Z-M001 TaxID=522448 RepID=A0A5B8NM73_9CHRO|nr:DUF4388 domain-containing protein [Euhalothece natronophila]QDZ39189.1 DUF4388 domain-containing protein [Euhalothece natronophila Z-M001]
MALSGFLNDFSLGETFQVLEQGEKTGLLSIRELKPTNLSKQETAPDQKYYIWFKQGRIIAAADRKDHQGLQTLMTKRGWVREETLKEIYQNSKGDKPLGLSLKSQGLLDHNQLKLLFVTQVMQQVCSLFKLDRGFFLFEQGVAPSFAEMTGLSKPATELTLMGLRMLKNWTPLADKLPEANSGLISLINTEPSYTLSAEEWEVWKYSNGKTALSTMANKLQIPLEKVQQIAFRLIVIGIVEELPMAEMLPPETDTTSEEEIQEPATVSHSFLNQLTSFLQSKAQ